MKPMTCKNIIALLLYGLLLAMNAASSYAHEYQCRGGGVERIISVEYESTSSGVPCAVRYDKPDEGGTSYPWRAQNTAGYCEEKAALLATQLEGYGFDCTRVESDDKH